MYLPPDAQDRLLDDIETLSATGSLFATEYRPDPADLARRTSAMARLWAEHGSRLDDTELMYESDRTRVTEYLTNHGWRLSWPKPLGTRRGLRRDTARGGSVCSAPQHHRRHRGAQMSFWKLTPVKVLNPSAVHVPVAAFAANASQDLRKRVTATYWGHVG
jgi:O-methyltransferase involved in polyketide biosynthesis